MNKLLPTFALSCSLLMACNNPGTVPTPTPTPTPTTISSLTGTVVENVTPDDSFSLKTAPWKGGAGSVELYLINNLHTLEKSVTAPLNASGVFTLPLPGTVPATALEAIGSADFFSFKEIGCTGVESVNVSDPAAQLASGVVKVVTASRTSIVQNIEVNATVTANEAEGKISMVYDITEAGVLYADRPVKVTGKVNCPMDMVDPGLPGRLTLSIDYDLAAGWNKGVFQAAGQATLDRQGQQGQATGSMRTAPWPTTTWVAAKSAAALSTANRPISTPLTWR